MTNTNIEWESTDKDISNMYIQAASEDGEGGEFIFPLPYRFHTLQRAEEGNKWSENVHRTVFRLYGDIRSEVTKYSTGEQINLITDGVTSRKQTMLSLWNDIGTIDTMDMPNYLRQVPVRGWTPLSKALGITRAGKPDPYMRDYANGKRKYHEKLGITPTAYWWLAAHVTQYVGEEVFDGPRILILKKWQVLGLIKAVSNWRDFKGDDWSVRGFPFHMTNVRMEREMDTELTVRAGGTYDPLDKVVFNMADQPPVSFKDQAEAIIIGLDEWLVEQGCPIKDYPYQGAHPDGWTSEKPLAVVQREEATGASGGGFDEFTKESIATADRWSDKTDEDLVELMQEFGQKVPKTGRTRQKMIAALEKAHEGM